MANIGTTITYGGYSLNTDNIITASIELEQAPNKKINRSPRARQDGLVRTSGQYFDKPITHKGMIIGSTKDDLDARIDEIYKKLNTDGLNLDIAYLGGTRRYVADVDDIDIVRIPGRVGAKFTIKYNVPDGYGVAVGQTDLGIVNSTTTTATLGFSMPGTARRQYPVIIVTLTAMTSNSGFNTIGVRNAGTGLTMYGNFAAGDVFQITTTPGQQSVTRNGNPQDFEGVLPSWALDAGAVDVTNDFASRNVKVQALVTPRFM